MRTDSFRPRAWISIFTAIVTCISLTAGAQATDGIRGAGDALQLILPASAAGMTLARHDGKGTLQLAESAATSMGVTYGLKYSIHEERPDGGSHSFPSGHTSIAFCSADFLRKRYGWRAGLPAFVAAAFVGYSRVEAKEHYVHDVLAGAAIGVISSEIFTRPYGCDGRLSAIIGRDVRLRAAIEGEGRILVRFRIGGPTDRRQGPSLFPIAGPASMTLTSTMLFRSKRTSVRASSAAALR